MTRLDQRIYELGLVTSREKAKAVVMAGLVRVNGRMVDKPGYRVRVEDRIEVLEPPRYVSRAGYKLEHALSRFGIDVRGMVVLDVGASTGGFTDCLLQRGARKVYAVDVGRGQLDPKLREDQRVIFYEKLDARDLDFNHVPEKVDLITIDVSFISLTKILEGLKKFLKREGSILALVKPQFELCPREVKKGVVREDHLKVKALKKVIDYVLELDLSPVGIAKASPKGSKGNEEFFLLINFLGDNINIEEGIKRAVEEEV